MKNFFVCAVTVNNKQIKKEKGTKKKKKKERSSKNGIITETNEIPTTMMYTFPLYL